MNAVRGSIVVIIAIVIAVVILARGLDDPQTADTGGTTGTTAATTTSAAPPPPEPVPAPAPEPVPAPPSEPTAPPPGPDDIPPDLDPVGELTPPPQPPAASPVHHPSDVRLLVANGTSVCGAAGRLATSLSAQGYNVLPAVNADNPTDASTLYYVENYGATAAVVATLLQVDSSQVLPMPSSPPTAPGDAHVLVHIGADDLAQPNC